MFETLQIFRMSDAKSRHAEFRQTILAENVANADTPGYKARDTVSFRDTLSDDPGGMTMRATRASHLNGLETRARFVERDEDNAFTAPNGNSVSLEDQALKSVQAKRDHDQALAVYRSAMTILRSAIGRR